MSILIEKEAQTVSEATMLACDELGVSRNDVEIEVLQESSKGILGIGSKKAKIRLTMRNPAVTAKGLKAKGVLDHLLENLMDNYIVEINESDEQIKLNIVSGDDKGLLIGKRGETLHALEYIVGRIASMNIEDGKGKRVHIDVDGYKERRETTVVRLVSNAARKAKKTGKPEYLEYMPAPERKIAYNVLKGIRGVKIDTKQEGNNKTIIIVPTRGSNKMPARDEGTRSRRREPLRNEDA